jgi:hypothetical protein
LPLITKLAEFEFLVPQPGKGLEQLPVFEFTSAIHGLALAVAIQVYGRQ